MAETRKFNTHEKLLVDVITRQAGSVEKAILEGVMNSIEAGSSSVAVTLTSSLLTIKDNGRGFRTRQEIEKWFETFGQPHEESEGKRWAEFRMGRGQLFAFGKNRWRTNTFMMLVDIKKSMDYDLHEGLANQPGCMVEVQFYEPLTANAIHWLTNAISDQVRYVDVPITVNGAMVNIHKTEWDPKLSSEDANIVLGVKTSLRVYNMGVYVRDYQSHQFGVTGVIVSKKALKVNFARNDIMADCPVWRRIKKVIDSTDKLEFMLNKERLSEHERQFILDKYLAGEIEIKALEHCRLFKDVSGYAHSLLSICNGEYKVWSMAKKGDRVADMLMQMKKALILDKDELEQFLPCCDNGKLETLFKDLYRGMIPYVSFEKLSKDVDSRHTLIPENDWRPTELSWLELINSMDYRIRWSVRAMNDLCYGRSEWRKARIGMSASSLAWTDGKNFIAFDRAYLARTPFLDKYGAINVTSVTAIACTLAHEMAHDGDSTRQVHSPEFYELYHDLSFGIPKTVGYIVRWYNKERIAKLMARASKKKVKKGKVVQLKTERRAAAKTKRFKAAYKPKAKPKKRPVEDIEIPD